MTREVIKVDAGLVSSSAVHIVFRKMLAKWARPLIDLI